MKTCLILLAVATLTTAFPNRKHPVNGRLQQSPDVIDQPGTLPLDQTSPHIPGDFPEEVSSNKEVVEVQPENLPKKTEEASEEDEEDDSFNFFVPKGRGGVFNFFPVVVGGGGRGRNAEGPGGSMAIANSFSTGRRGTANSQATAYGDSAAVLRNNPQN